MTIPNTTCAVCNKKIYRVPSRLTRHNFCSIKHRNVFYSKRFSWKDNKKIKHIKVREYDRNKRKENKLRAISLFGGKCSLCGYNKCSAALDFHHTDPNKKDDDIKDMFNKYSWETTYKELKKCILVCSNCHRELHWRERNE